MLPAAGGEKETGSKEGEGEDEGRKGGRRDSKTVEEIGGAREERNDIEAVTAEDVWSTSQHCMTCNTYESGPGNRLSKHSFGYNNIPIYSFSVKNNSSTLTTLSLLPVLSFSLNLPAPSSSFTTTPAKTTQ